MTPARLSLVELLVGQCSTVVAGGRFSVCCHTRSSRYQRRTRSKPRHHGLEEIGRQVRGATAIGGTPPPRRPPVRTSSNPDSLWVRTADGDICYYARADGALCETRGGTCRNLLAGGLKTIALLQQPDLPAPADPRCLPGVLPGALCFRLAPVPLGAPTQVHLDFAIRDDDGDLDGVNVMAFSISSDVQRAKLLMTTPGEGCRLARAAVRDQRGTAFLMGLMIVMVMTLLGVALFEMSTIEAGLARSDALEIQAFYCAEAEAARVYALYAPDNDEHAVRPSDTLPPASLTLANALYDSSSSAEVTAGGPVTATCTCPTDAPDGAARWNPPVSQRTLHVRRGWSGRGPAGDIRRHGAGRLRLDGGRRRDCG